MRARFIVILLVAIVGSAPVIAEESPYSGHENREIKALSEKQINSYLAGRGMGLALPGELNGYPGPKHALELASDLKLTSVQWAEIEGVFAAMQSEAVVLGKQIVAAERSLDAAFADGSITHEILKKATEQIGLLQGQLRATHLLAHLETKEFLTTEQNQEYVQLRGYNKSHHSQMKHHGHDH